MSAVFVRSFNICWTLGYGDLAFRPMQREGEHHTPRTASPLVPRECSRILARHRVGEEPSETPPLLTMFLHPKYAFFPKKTSFLILGWTTVCGQTALPRELANSTLTLPSSSSAPTTKFWCSGRQRARQNL